MFNLVLLNSFFAGVLLVFIIMPVTSNWLWLGFIFIWCWTEGVLARQASVKWWHMLTLFIVLGVIEFTLISVFKIN